MGMVASHKSVWTEGILRLVVGCHRQEMKGGGGVVRGFGGLQLL
jgi:hypothetical protein